MIKLTVEQISNKLLVFLERELSVNKSSISYETKISELGADSLTLVKILLFIEKEFKVNIPDKELTKNNFDTVLTISKCILKYLNETNMLSNRHKER